jgi:hypothetical protein
LGVEDRLVILHVGWPKTATTSLQSYLLGYPNLAGKPFGRAGAPFARKVVDDIVRSPEWSPEALEQLIDSSWHDHTLPVLLSNESLIEMPQREWFDDLVGPFEIARRLVQLSGDKRVLLTLRSPRELLRSMWLHHVREGRLQSYPDFLRRVSEDRRNGRGPLSIFALGETYGDLFGVEKVAVAFTEDFAGDMMRFWQRFADFLGTGAFIPTPTTEARKLNATNLGPIGFEMSVNRLLDFYGGTLRLGGTRELRRAITRRVSRRLGTDHSRHFSRFVTIEDQLVSDLAVDIAAMRGLFTVL